MRGIEMKDGKITVGGLKGQVCGACGKPAKGVVISKRMVQYLCRKHLDEHKQNKEKQHG